MDVADLYRLSRYLRDVVLTTISDSGQSVSAGQMTIVEDVFRHAPTTISEITKRTQLAQSFVSRTVLSLKDSAVVTMEPSVIDKRQTLISFNPKASSFVQSHSQQSVLPALKKNLPRATAKQIDRIESLLKELADALLSSR